MINNNSMVIENQLLNFGFSKKQFAVLGEEHYIKYLNPCLLVEVIYEYRNRICLRINIYNKIDIENNILQVFKQVISDVMLDNIINTVGLRYIVEDFILKFIKSILQGELVEGIKDY